MSLAELFLLWDRGADMLSMKEQEVHNQLELVTLPLKQMQVRVYASQTINELTLFQHEKIEEGYLEFNDCKGYSNIFL